MREQVRHFPVNWVDGMKISKDHFIDQERAVQCQLHDVASLHLSPIRYGLLPSADGLNENFDVRISADGQRLVRVTVLTIDAVTRGGARIVIPAFHNHSQPDGSPTWSFQLPTAAGQMNYWFFVVTNPFQRIPYGDPDPADFPPRMPYVAPGYSIQMVNSNEYRQFANHPFALPVGKIIADANNVRIQEYIPPSLAISAHPELVAILADIDQFYATLEVCCLNILQNIHRMNQDNEIAKMVMSLCDQLLPFAGKTLNDLRWTSLHESPAALFATVAALARIIKNTIDTRVSSGKEDLMNYFSEWNKCNPGEMESRINELVTLRYDNNNIIEAIHIINPFMKVITGLFETLTELEFIGKRKKAVETFIKVEEQVPRRRFFG